MPTAGELSRAARATEFPATTKCVAEDMLNLLGERLMHRMTLRKFNRSIIFAVTKTQRETIILRNPEKQRNDFFIFSCCSTSAPILPNSLSINSREWLHSVFRPFWLIALTTDKTFNSNTARTTQCICISLLVVSYWIKFQYCKMSAKFSRTISAIKFVTH